MSEGHVFICGDPHGEFGPLIESVHRHRPEAVVLAGDIQARRPLDEELASILPLTQVWWIPGNHDTDSDADYDNLFGSGLADRNLDGRVVTIAGLRIAGLGGLGGIFRGQVWMPPDTSRVESATDYLAKCGNYLRGGLPRRHRSTIFPQTYNALLRQHEDVLVSHEAPACHPHGFEAIDTLIKAMGVQRAFHGLSDHRTVPHLRSRCVRGSHDRGRVLAQRPDLSRSRRRRLDRRLKLTGNSVGRQRAG